MLGHQFAYSAAPIRRVREVQFGILSPEEIVRNCTGMINCLADNIQESIFSSENRAPRGY